jgi:hypothetical protein
MRHRRISTVLEKDCCLLFAFLALYMFMTTQPNNASRSLGGKAHRNRDPWAHLGVLFLSMLVAIVAACGASDTPTVQLIAAGPDAGADSALDPNVNSGFVILANGASATQLALKEGATGQLTVALKSAPSGPVTAKLIASSANVVSLGPDMLSFDASNYNIPQTVVVSALQDDNTSNETLKISVTADGVAPGLLDVAVTDDDVQALVATPQELTITEGGSDTFTVRPAFKPSGALTVTLANNNPAGAKVSAQTLTFTEANFATAQTVTVTGEIDANVTDESVVVTLTAPGLADTAVPVTVVDRDVLNITTNPSAVTVVEGQNKTFTVSLTKMPPSTVTVSLTSSNPAKGTVSPATLTFTPANYASAQPVTVTGVNDNDTSNEALSVLCALVGVTSREVAVTVTDKDVQAIVPSVATLSVAEGASGSFGVALAFDPVTPLTVSLVSANTSAISLAAPTLTFTSANYAVPQMVSVAGVIDANTASEVVPISLTATGVVAKTVTVTQVDKDVQGLLVSPTAVSVSETGTTTVTVALKFNPLSNANVTIASSDATAVTVSPATLTFTSANFATPQTVTLTGVMNAGTVNRTANVTATLAGSPSVTVPVTIVDAGAQSFTVAPASLALTEAGAVGTFTVKLAQAPTGTLTAVLASANTGIATVSPASLSFTAANFSMPQTVTVTPLHDTNAVNDSTTVSVTSAGVATQSVGVNVADIDVQSIILSAATLSVTEGATATFTARLAFAPASTTSVNVGSANTAAVTASPTSLSFTTANFASPQTITITGVPDANTVSETVAVTLSSAGVSNAVVQVATVDTTTAASCDMPATLPSPSNGNHNAGTSCVQSGCHNVARASVNGAMTIGGTLYGNIAGGAALAQATIHVVDATGVDVKISTATNGNFWSTQAVVFPVSVRASKCPNADQKMVSQVAAGQGSCNACHGAGNRIHLP